MHPIAKQEIMRKSSTTASQPTVLLVEDESSLVEVIHDILRRDIGCTVITATDLESANRILATQSVELVITDVNLPDGDGMALLPAVRKFHPTATAIVMTGAPSMEGAISAIRSGAIDFVPKPFGSVQLVEHVRKALARQVVLAKEEKRLDRLKKAVRKLNASRRVISKKVDLLCNDLVAAYGELSKQMDGVRTQEGFRKYVEGAKDLEQLLCHAMDWLLRQMGYSNVAVWLTAEDGEFQLGAYMKYTLAGDAPLTDAIKRVILPRATRDSLVHLNADALADQFTPAEAKLFKGQDILAVNCTYLGDSLAALVFFRDARSPFEAEFETLLKAVSPIFAVTLASVVRGTDNEADDEGPFLESPDDLGGMIEPEDSDVPKKKKSEKIDPADWWKRGEESPF